jgi:flagellar hook protein FlgE
MTIFGAFFSGVSGIHANAQALGTISDNIANVNTTGYKRAETRFKNLVTTPPIPAPFYLPAGVQTSVHNLIDRQGLLQASQSNTHLGIVGQGFFVVADVNNANNTTGTFQYTRAGEFEPDQDGNLRNTAGFFLRGWPLDANGKIPTNQKDLSATETVNITEITGIASATSAVNIQANLQASQRVTSAPQDLSTAAVTNGDTDLSTGAPSLTNGTTITADAVGAVSTFTFVTGTPAAGQFNTLNQLASLINAASGMVGSVSNNVLTVTGDPGNALTVSGTAAINLFGAASTTTAATYDPTSATLNMASNSITPDFERSVQIFDSKGGARTLTFAYLKSQVANQWYTEVHIEPSSSVTSPSGIIASGTTAFNSAGGFDSTNTTAALTGAITVPWATVLGVAAQTVTVDFGTTGQANGLSQFDSPSQLVSFDVNGALFGKLAGVTVNDAGTVTAQFDNGSSKNLYRLPVATFRNPNGLQPRSGGSFTQTTASGTFNPQEAGTGTAGLIAPASIEASTVDLAEEFTDMIVIQQAFSAAGRVITTSDEMLDEVIRLKR